VPVPVPAQSAPQAVTNSQARIDAERIVYPFFSAARASAKAAMIPNRQKKGVHRFGFNYKIFYRAGSGARFGGGHMALKYCLIQTEPAEPHDAIHAQELRHRHLPAQTRSMIMFALLQRLAASAAVLLVLALGGCTAPTTILSNANPSGAPATAWEDYQSLPTDVHGAAPGHDKAELAALFPAYHPAHYAALGGLPATGLQRRMVLYINPAYRPGPSQLCDGAAHFPRGKQDGQSAYVVGALCDGTRLITVASAKILVESQDPADLAHNFTIIRDQLYQSLFPGANDPYRYYEGD
jgi:hypothetical protein